MFLVLYVLLTMGILLNRYLGDWILVYKNSEVSYTIAVVLRIPNLILDKVFPREISYNACYSQSCDVLLDSIF